MKLDTEFCKLPLRFDSERLTHEVRQFTEAEWRPHPQGHRGNTALPLIAVNGDPANDAVKGPMRPTAFLERCPYLQQVLDVFETPLGRTRLMRIAAQAEATPHVDTNYYWMQRVRIHVPIVTFPEVRFLCGAAEVHMAAGEAWIFDTWRRHNVLNPTDHDRIHLVSDSVGSAAFWELVEQGGNSLGGPTARTVEARFIPPELGRPVELALEDVNFPVVMSPWEMEVLLTGFCHDLRAGEDGTAELAGDLIAVLRQHHRRWRALWARFGDGSAGWPHYQAAVKQLQDALPSFENRLHIANGMEAVEIVRQHLVRPAINPDLAEPRRAESVGPRVSPPLPATAAQPAANAPRSPSPGDRFDRPIFIVAAPRSGSTFLFETLARSPGAWTVGGESHGLFESIARLNPVQRGFDSNRLTAADADPEIVQTLQANFLARLHNRDGQALGPNTTPFRLLEKTPKNSLRIPFLNAVFPDALFIYLYREPPENLGSIIDAWQSGKFVTYPKLPGWTRPPWSLVLIPEWRQLRDRNLGEIAAAQWAATHQHMIDDLEQLPAERWCSVTYADLVADPQGQMERLCAFAGIPWDQDLRTQTLPNSRHTLTPPDPSKWRRHATLIEPVLPGLEAIDRRARATVERGLGRASKPTPTTPDQGARIMAEARPPAAPTPSPAPAPADDGSPFRSVYTSNIPAILQQLRISLLVSTYQAGRLIVARADGNELNTHFRDFPMPMGLAYDRNRLALGIKAHVWEFRNQPEVGRKLEPVGKHDACYLPRSVHTTGDIRIHEIAYAGEELWIVNTRFSCLCTLDREHSFVPRWRPPFVTALAPEDRCHLNGMAIIDERPKYVTCLGATDSAGGWRENKASGGLLLDVDTGETLLTGLSMPHSPRWYADRLWVLESGDGGLGYVDLDRGQVETIAKLPGFTRGLDFIGNLAFVGLSQVRETATFSGLPITERLQERTCGVWVVDIQTGKTVAFLRFDGAVQEIFAVQVLHGQRFPDIIKDDDDAISNSFVLPDEALRDVPAGVG